MGSNLSIQLEGVSVVRGSVRILQEVSLSFQAGKDNGDYRALGSGKSTLLKVAAGIIIRTREGS
jgi:ABC-type molybdenum transport system ATPase subunit/photorepair protein PhrA